MRSGTIRTGTSDVRGRASIVPDRRLGCCLRKRLCQRKNDGVETPDRWHNSATVRPEKGNQFSPKRLPIGIRSCCHDRLTVKEEQSSPHATTPGNDADSTTVTETLHELILMRSHLGVS